jgi:hypothetical protein
VKEAAGWWDWIYFELWEERIDLNGKIEEGQRGTAGGYQGRM